MNIEISIIVPVFNQEIYIGRCIRSLLNQTISRERYEIIVVDDGSTDQTKKILNVFSDSINIINNNKNMGLPESLNIGIRNAKGRFIVRVDSDDYVHSEYLNLMELHLANNDHIDSICCDYSLVDNNEKVIRIESWINKPIGCGIMFRIEHLIELGLYDEQMKTHEDKDLLIRYLEKYNVYNIPISLYRYRRHSNNMTNKSSEMDAYFKKLKKKHESNFKVPKKLISYQ